MEVQNSELKTEDTKPVTLTPELRAQATEAEKKKAKIQAQMAELQKAMEAEDKILDSAREALHAERIVLCEELLAKSPVYGTQFPEWTKCIAFVGQADGKLHLAYISQDAVLPGKHARAKTSGSSERGPSVMAQLLDAGYDAICLAYNGQHTALRMLSEGHCMSNALHDMQIAGNVGSHIRGTIPASEWAKVLGATWYVRHAVNKTLHGCVYSKDAGESKTQRTLTPMKDSVPVMPGTMVNIANAA